MSSPVPTDYAATLESIKRLVHEARYIAQRRVNTELLRLYWQIGATIIERQKTAPWGSKVLSRLSADLRAEFPGAKDRLVERIIDTLRELGPGFAFVGRQVEQVRERAERSS
jgi:predicted nuclease of restriction endonuclease-like (RecB) superfamily